MSYLLYKQANPNVLDIELNELEKHLTHRINKHVKRGNCEGLTLEEKLETIKSKTAASKLRTAIRRIRFDLEDQIN